MLENEVGKRLSGFGNGTHWLLFKELLREPALWIPLHAAVYAHIDAVVATHGTGGTGHQVAIDSTAAGPSVFGRLAADWEAKYQRWQADLRRRKTEIEKDVEPRQVEGMAIWHALAELRPDERWLAPAYKQPPRVYKLLEIVHRTTA